MDNPDNGLQTSNMILSFIKDYDGITAPLTDALAGIDRKSGSRIEFHRLSEIERYHSDDPPDDQSQSFHTSLH